MVNAKTSLAIATACLLAAGACAQQGQSAATAGADHMTGAELQALLSQGRTLRLGGPEEGYSGEVRLAADGTGDGEVVFTNGRAMQFVGTWAVEGDRFCREWSFNEYLRECETWRRLGDNKAEVFIDGKRVGLNSW